MAEIPINELIAELQSIRLSILNLEQFVVPPVKESEARRKVEMLLALLDVGNL